MKRPTLSCHGRVDGMGKLDPAGSYVRVIYKARDCEHYIQISEGEAAQLVAEINGSLTTSPSAISEAPTSAEAVKTSPEVGEMVERLKESWPSMGDSAAKKINRILNERREAASLLIALDAERGRLREALKPLLKYKPTRIDYCPGESGEQAYSEAVEVFDRASSALPASDEGTTNE